METGEPILVNANGVPDPNGKPDLMTFKKFAFTFLLNAEEGNATPVQLERWIGVIAKFRSIKKAGEKIALDDEDQATLVKIAERISSKLPPFIAIQTKPFVEALKNMEPCDTLAHLPKSLKSKK